MSNRRSGADIAIACSFCLKDSQEVKNLIAGQDDVYICNECVSMRSDELAECSFCSKRFRMNDIFGSGERDAYICNECLAICSGIVAKHKKVHQESVGNKQHE